MMKSERVVRDRDELKIVKKTRGLSQNATAERLGISRKTVSKHERRALMKLQPWLAGALIATAKEMAGGDPEKLRTLSAKLKSAGLAG